MGVRAASAREMPQSSSAFHRPREDYRPSSSHARPEETPRRESTSTPSRSFGARVIDAGERGVKPGEVLKDFLKILPLFVKALDACDWGVSAELRALAKLVATTKEMIQAPAIPFQGIRLLQHATSIFTGIDPKTGKQRVFTMSVKETFFACNGLISPVYEVLSECLKVGAVRVGAVFMKRFAVFHFGSIVIGQGRCAYVNLYSLYYGDLNSTQEDSKLLDLCKNVSLVALGSIGLAGSAIGFTPVVSVAILVCSVYTCAFSMVKHFHDNV